MAHNKRREKIRERIFVFPLLIWIDVWVFGKLFPIECHSISESLAFNSLSADEMQTNFEAIVEISCFFLLAIVFN